MKSSLFVSRRTTAKSFAKDVFIEQERKSKGIEDINRRRLNHKSRRLDIFSSYSCLCLSVSRVRVSVCLSVSVCEYV